MVGLLILGRTYCFPLSCGHLKESHQPPMKRYFFGAFVTFVSNRRCHIEVLRPMCFNSFPAWPAFTTSTESLSACNDSFWPCCPGTHDPRRLPLDSNLCGILRIWRPNGVKKIRPPPLFISHNAEKLRQIARQKKAREILRLRSQARFAPKEKTAAFGKCSLCGGRRVAAPRVTRSG